MKKKTIRKATLKKLERELKLAHKALITADATIMEDAWGVRSHQVSIDDYLEYIDFNIAENLDCAEEIQQSKEAQKMIRVAAKKMFKDKIGFHLLIFSTSITNFIYNLESLRVFSDMNGFVITQRNKNIYLTAKNI